MITAGTNLFAQYDPLSITKSMKIVGGTTKQAYYVESNSFIPDRSLTPLTLQPVIFVSDPDGIIPAGDKAGNLSAARWYVGSTDAANLITARESDGRGNANPYALGKNGSLVVYKNIPQDSPELLIFEGEFYDTRRLSSVYADMSVQLTTTSNAESVAAPVLTIDRPRAWIYNPLKGIGKQSVSCQLFRQGKEVPDANARYWWYVVESDRERLVGSDELDLFYVSGQHTKTLTIDPEYLKKTIFRCKAEYFEDTAPVTPGEAASQIDTKFKRRFPKNLQLKVNVRTGERILPTMATIKAEAIMSTNDIEVTDPTKHFNIRWYRNTLIAGATNVEIGRGKSLSVDRTTLGLNVTERPHLFATVEEHDPYMALADKNGDVLTDENGNLLVGF